MPRYAYINELRINATDCKINTHYLLNHEIFMSYATLKAVSNITWKG